VVVVVSVVVDTLLMVWVIVDGGAWTVEVSVTVSVSVSVSVSVHGSGHLLVGLRVMVVGVRVTWAATWLWRSRRLASLVHLDVGKGTHEARMPTSRNTLECILSDNSAMSLGQ